ncbi:hypothetical protein DFJ58DRAFT_845756 [Suillus subalutaceus]|uniref:uncharacterized protein n=1 Tax=Suillus subalutaceus TaxID=48586 RepID=UPI001B8839BA|nr:uncharacterized protein DFJ58DRAFT_845756 [Suillus subalutaceus]KAG1839336.1 hypothetical protein DFJ58DRAFT_845756 [Suillus subalutaceus]
MPMIRYYPLHSTGQSGEDIELQGHGPAVVEVPCTKGKPRNFSAREVALAKQKQKYRTKPLHSENSTAGSSQTPKPNVPKSSSQPHAAGSSSSTTPTVGDPTIATTSTPSRLDATIRQAGLWARFWLFIGCLSPETILLYDTTYHLGFLNAETKFTFQIWQFKIDNGARPLRQKSAVSTVAHTCERRWCLTAPWQMAIPLKWVVPI